MNKQFVVNNNVIGKFHEIHFNAVTIVSYKGLTNMGLWRSLNINVHNTSFKQSVTHNSVHVLTGIPHLLETREEPFH